MAQQTARTVKQYQNNPGEDVWVDDNKVAQSGALHAVAHVVDIITAALLLLLSIRFMFEIFATERVSKFSQLVYVVTEPLVTPFAGLFPNFSLGVDGGRIDVATIVGMISIAFISYALQQLLNALQPSKTIN